MRHILINTLVAMLLLVPNSVWAQQQFKFPDNPGGLPSIYLERFEVTDPSRQLNERERHELCRFFVKAYVIAMREYSNELLNTGTPIYRLFKANFPAVSDREGEGGAVIFLSEITRFLNTIPEYRNDIEVVLRANLKSRKRCR